MAAVTRQPFAPLDGARLQSLSSLKNRQNALLPNVSVKRKASEVVDHDSENQDPSLSSKRAKGADPSASKDYFKPSAFILKSASTPVLPLGLASSPPASVPARVSRALLQPRSPAARLSAGVKPTPLTAPAGRSPTRGGNRRAGILSRRRTARIDPPSFGAGARGSAPFSLDAALKGTLSSYTGSSRGSVGSDALAPASAASWDFAIHEDTPEQEMTNLLQHSTYVLDISSDEENETRASRERAEGRDKENIPPPDDVSQTASARGASDRQAGAADKMVVEKQRGPLVEMDAADYYAEGCDSETVVIVPGDEDEANEVGTAHMPSIDAALQLEPSRPQPRKESEDNVFVSTTALLAERVAPYESDSDDEAANIDAIMGKTPVLATAPVEEDSQAGFETCENFEVWESNSAKDPGSPAAAGEEDAEAAP